MCKNDMWQCHACVMHVAMSLLWPACGMLAVRMAVLHGQWQAAACLTALTPPRPPTCSHAVLHVVHPWLQLSAALHKLTRLWITQICGRCHQVLYSCMHVPSPSSHAPHAGLLSAPSAPPISTMQVHGYGPGMYRQHGVHGVHAYGGMGAGSQLAVPWLVRCVRLVH